MSETLKALLLYVKQHDSDRSWTAVRNNVLAKLYHPDMSMFDTLRVVLSAWTEALLEKRFQMPQGMAAEDLLLAPIKGFHSVEMLGPLNLQTAYTVEQFYSSILHKMLADLMLTRVDWCRAELGLDNAPAPALALAACAS